MSNNKKRGITITSLVVYVVIFSIITALVSMIYTNMNENLFSNRGKAINYTTFNKLQYNITESALASNDITSSASRIIYSNGDEYVYDNNKHIILLNGGILCSSVNNFIATITEQNGVKQLNLQVSFNKYMNELNKNIISNVEVN